MFRRLTKFLILIIFFLGSASFGLTLRESVEIALENNPEILAQAEGINKLESEADQAFSGFLPELKIEGTYGRSYRTGVSYELLRGEKFTLTPDDAANVTIYGAKLSQNLYTGGKLESRLDIARVRVKIAEEELKRRKQELIYKVILAYYDVLQAKRLLDLSLESMDLTNAHLELVKSYYSLGRVPKADLLFTNVKFAEAEFRKIRTENELEAAKIEFNRILGREIEIPILFKEMDFGLQEAAPPSSQDLLSLAFEHRPEWKVLNFQKIIGERKIVLAQSEFAPDLILSGSISKSYLDYPETEAMAEEDATGVADSFAWNIYGMLSWTIFDGLRTPNQIRGAQAELAEIKKYEREIENRIAAEIRQARLNLDAANLLIQVAQKEVEYAEENLALAQERYRKGVGGNVEFLEAQAALSKAKTDQLQAKADYELAKAKINLAVGKEVFALF